MKTKESVYRQCSAAIDRLVEEPPKQHGGVFTEIDVQIAAASDDWKPAEYSTALHDSNELCGTRFRHRKLCRYGPVVIGTGQDRIEDYARIAGKIVYADAETGPTVWKTPNGEFQRMMVEDDHLSRQGRRSGTNRNDAEPWKDQSLASPPRKPIKRRRIKTKDLDLTRLVIDLAERVESLEEDEKQWKKFVAEQAKRQIAA